ncbi:MAG: Mth938-like domain-containing protein [Gammaproteobacteria bacterium]
MKFNLEVSAGNYHILSYQSGQISVVLMPDVKGAVASQQTLDKSLVIMPRELVRDWPPQAFDDLDAAHFDMLSALQPELVLFGSGARLRFPSPALTANLLNQGIGVEVMDTAAACRTYNILMNEGRWVAAALLMI